MTTKYGHEVPRTLEDCKRIDAANGNSLWTIAIEKEMANVNVAIEVLEEDQPIPVGWQRSSGHLVFDVKMDFTQKA